MLSGHNIGSYMKVLTGQGPCEYEATALVNFIATTSWKPDAASLTSYSFEGFTSYTSSHSKEVTRELYRKHLNTVLVNGEPFVLDEDELVPFYWSAGLITDPEFARDTRLYMYSRCMGNNIQLFTLSFFPAWMISGVMRSYAHLSCGQTYTGELFTYPY